MRHLACLIFSLAWTTGCATTALQERGDIRTQALWIKQTCMPLFHAGGVPVLAEDGSAIWTYDGKLIPISLTPEDAWFKCGDVAVDRRAIQAAAEDNIPREPNVIEWVAAYAFDALVVGPIAVAGVAALVAAGGSTTAGTNRSAYTDTSNGTPVYDASQCVGPIIMGECKGSTIGPPKATCHGTILNGQCTGPMF
jgi:hypothetical protein